MRNFKSQLRSHEGDLIATSGGVVYVTAAGGTAKLALKDKDGAALSNPLALTRGGFDFYVADTVTAGVDLYILAPTGHMVIRKSVQPSGDASIAYDNKSLKTTIVIPVNVADQTGDATETLTGFTLPGAVQAAPAFHVVAIDATETIDVGTNSAASGDANGFIAAASVGTAGYIKGTLTNGSATLGALLVVQDSANAGDGVPEQSTASIGKQVSYTLTTGADTATGFIVLPVALLPTAII